MPTVKLAGKKVQVGDQALPLLSGEVHYWRLDPARWREILRRVRELGLSLIASYVCWDHHQVAPGEFDFRGLTTPQHNLAAFLDLAAELDFWLLIRPGPYIYAEWANGGVPAEAARFHRLHPAFQEAARAYIEAVCEVLRPYLATRGGPVVLLQAENEPHPWHQFYEAQLGLGPQPGLFQEFLANLYNGDLTALNAAWETTLPGFDQARPVTQPGPRQRGYLNRYLDFVRFQHWYSQEAVRRTAEMFREAGIDVPIYTNAYTLHGIQNWREFEAACDLAGPDIYPSRAFGQPDEHQDCLHMLRYARTYSRLPYIPEMQAGIWEGGQETSGVLPPNHYEMLGLSALLAGIVGWNWYMLVNRDNWVMSPINELGHPRPALCAAFERLIHLFNEIDPPSLVKLTVTSVTVDPLHQTAQLGDDQSREVLRALYQADLDYECYDVNTGQIARPLLLYGGGSWLSANAQRQLLTYVEGGGTLVFFQDLPVTDDRLRPLNLLGLHMPDSILGSAPPQQLALDLGGEPVTLSSPAFCVFDNPPGEPLIAQRIPDIMPHGDELNVHTALPVGSRYTVGYRLWRGAGSLIVIGLTPTPALLVALHHWLGLAPPSRALLPQVSTALFRQGKRYILIAVNAGDEDRACPVVLNPGLFNGASWLAHDLRSGAEQRFDLGVAGQVTVHLPRKNGTVVEIRPI